MAADRRLDRRGLLRLGLAGLTVGAIVGVRELAAGDETGADAASGSLLVAGQRHAPRARARPARSLTLVNRADWGADERIRSRKIEFDPTVEKFVVHHTGTELGRDSAAAMRELYRSTVASGYRDVPYHWLIDPDGVVFEGRWARRMRSGELPNGEDTRGRCVRGGHALHHNERTIGIAFLGNFVDRAPSDAARDTLVSLLAWKCERWGVDPHGSTRYRLGDGSRPRFPNICAHRTVRATACPGPAVAAGLPDLRAAVAERLAAVD
jgi:hypothetical protein